MYAAARGRAFLKNQITSDELVLLPLRGENLSKYLQIKAADGYGVLFSLAELDSSFTSKVVILADKMEGKPIPKGKGPFRIIVPDERKPARSILEGK